MSREAKGDWRELNSLTLVPQTSPAPFGFSHQEHLAGMERLELSKPGLKGLSLDRFAFIPVSKHQCGRGESNSQDTRFKRVMSALCITPAKVLSSSFSLPPAPAT
jgi:hypothetical protein